LPPARREAAARHYVARPGLHLDPELQNSIVTETMRVLNDSIFAPVFGEGSLAEVPVTGDMGNGKLINGQIDRLIVRDHDILIVDFKTNRPSPTDAVSIPASYRAQMAAYAAALRRIYPEKAIKCALLWTDQPLLMAIEI
jgi:ATP-dependent helicase/nuclease subunit A